MNAVTHGLLAETLLLPGEDPEEYAAFADEMLAVLEPEDALQEYLAERLVRDMWRLRRFDNIEEGILIHNLEVLEAAEEAVGGLGKPGLSSAA